MLNIAKKEKPVDLDIGDVLNISRKLWEVNIAKDTGA